MATHLFRWHEVAEEKEVSKAVERGRRLAVARLTAVLGALAFVLLTFVTSPPASQAAFPGANGKIAFQSNRDGNDEIYVMNADGTNQTRLTNNAANDREASWSPDGTKIAFESDRDGNREIYVMNADGTNQTRLTNNTVVDGEPTWSPDGTKIAFESDRDGNAEIYVMNADGTNQTRLTNNTANDVAPSWSPDGTKLVFSSNQGASHQQIWVMNADSTNQTRLTTADDGGDSSPDWSPDGTKIGFHSNRGNVEDVWVMNADGTNQGNLTNSQAIDTNVSWSPDGTKIAFHSNRDGNFEIYVMNADGSNQTRLTNNTAVDVIPAWQPLSIPVAIDIKPGSFPNSINLKSNRKIPVAILTTDTFDATTVDSTTIRFGKTGTEAALVQSALEDVDGDGDTDMILHFNTQDTGIQCGDTSASLTGETFGGQAIEGADSINTVGCK